MHFANSKRDEYGYDHHYYQQFYKGIRVEFGAYAVHGKSNSVLSINGNFHPVKNVDVAVAVSEVDALKYALNYIGAKKYKREIPEEEAWIKKNFNSTYSPKGELVIVNAK